MGVPVTDYDWHSCPKCGGIWRLSPSGPHQEWSYADSVRDAMRHEPRVCIDCTLKEQGGPFGPM